MFYENVGLTQQPTAVSNIDLKTCDLPFACFDVFYLSDTCSLIKGFDKIFILASFYIKELITLSIISKI